MIIRKLIGSTLLALSGAMALAADAPSPARVQLDEFIAAFNSGDRARIEAFGREHAPPDFIRAAVLDDTMRMYASSGGLDLVEVEESDPLSVRSRVRERKTGAILKLTVQVNPAEPTRLTMITLHSGEELVKK
jgi:D-alanyl-D-alanine carboxypeptidase